MDILNVGICFRDIGVVTAALYANVFSRATYVTKLIGRPFKMSSLFTA